MMPAGRWILGARMPAMATLGLLVAAVAANAALQDQFFSAYSLTSSFATFLPIATVAVAQVIIVLTGGIDLSLGTIVTLSSVVTVQLVAGDAARLPLALAAGLITGVACGLANGVVVGVLRLQPIVATFATSFVFSGLALMVLPTPGGSVPSVVTSTYRQLVGGVVPVSAVLLLLVWLAWRLLYAHRTGRHIYAIGGGGEQAAFASAVPVTAVKVATYGLGGLFASLAGFAMLANSGAGDPFAGNALTLGSIAAVVIGGTRLRGGVGGAGGAIAGAIVLALIQSLVFFARVPQDARELVNGAIVIVAIALAGLLTASRAAPERAGSR